MRINKIKAAMKEGKKAYGAGLVFPSAPIVELIGYAGFDFVSFDGEHGYFTISDIEEMCRVADQMGLTPTARVPNSDSSTILRFLDRGIMGITVPHVNTKAQAQAVVKAARYAPQGLRSFGSGRGNNYGIPQDKKKWMADVNEQVLVITMIEDVEAIKNLDDLLSVDGIDLFTFGPQDLAQSMGYPGQPDHPKVKEAMAQVVQRIHAAGKKVTEDAMSSVRVTDLILNGGREFLRRARGS